MSFLCEVFNFFLNIFIAVVDVVVAALNALISGAMTVLSTAADALIGGVGGTLLPLLLGGVFIYYMVNREEDPKREPRSI